MKVRFYREDNHWVAGLYCGKGGVSSLVHFVKSKRLLPIFRVFTIKNLKTAFYGKSQSKRPKRNITKDR